MTAVEKNSSSCPICIKHRAPIDSLIAASENLTLVHYPISVQEPAAYRGHLMVEVRRHVTSFGELREAEAAEVGVTISRAARLLTDQLGAEHVYVFTIGHLVPHLHIHIVPRYPGTPEEFWGGKQVSDWPGAPRLNESEVAALARSLRS